MYENIKSLRPYFYSLREINTNVSLDIKIPINWGYVDIVTQHKALEIKIQDKNDKIILLSLISDSTQEGYENVFACAKNIIIVNKDEEEKQKLFQQKVKELQELFKNENLDKLKVLNFHDNIYGSEDTTRIRMVGQGNQEGQLGYLDTQEADD